MIFLSPLALLLAAAAIVPLLLHLRRGRVTRVVEFPGARYLARATLEHQRSIRAKSSLLLLVRIATVLALTLAAARPLARLGGGHGPTALAVVVDNSASSGTVIGGRSALDVAKDGVRALLRDATAADRLWLFTADGGRRAGTAQELLAVVDSLQPLDGAGRPRDAAAAAVATVEAASELAPAVAIATDGQASAWTAPIVAARATVVVMAPSGAAPANRAITAATPLSARWSGRGSLRVAVTSRDSVPFRVAIGTRTVARGIAPPGGFADVTVPGTAYGWVVGTVEIDRDELAVDDSRWFAVWQGEVPAVRAAAGPFVDDALAALVAAGTVREGSGILLVTADALDRTPALAVAPIDAARIGAANRALARRGIPWRFGAVRGGASPLRGAGIDGAVVTRRYALTPTALVPAETLAVVDGEPWAVAGPGYVLVASALDTAMTTLPVTAEFVPWLAKALVERLSSGGVARDASPGATVVPPPGADALLLPDSGAIAASGPVAIPHRAGVYFWTRDGAPLGALVVNVEEEESDVRRAGDGVMAAAFPPRGARVESEAGEFARRAFDSARRSVSPLLTAVALALLVLESALAGAVRAAKGRAPGGAEGAKAA